MKLKKIYQEVVKKGIEADIRGGKEIERLLKESREKYAALDKRKKELFDPDTLFNPFSDTRILCGDPEGSIRSAIVGIDVDAGELLLVSALKSKGTPIDLVISHHPAGKAYANFYEVMDLQITSFIKSGVSLSVAENLLAERKAEVGRRVSSANHTRAVDAARWLKLSLLCMHTPCDNLAYQYLENVIDKERPRTLGKIIEILDAISEYRQAAKDNNPPKIVIGSKKSHCRNIYLEFTGGTEGPKDIYANLSSCGIDTIIAMHQSEEHFKKCKEAKINVIFASHIASDGLGVNLMLDYLESKAKLKIYEFSGFRRFSRNKHR